MTLYLTAPDLNATLTLKAHFRFAFAKKILKLESNASTQKNNLSRFRESLKMFTNIFLIIKLINKILISPTSSLYSKAYLLYPKHLIKIKCKILYKLLTKFPWNRHLILKKHFKKFLKPLIILLKQSETRSKNLTTIRKEEKYSTILNKLSRKSPRILYYFSAIPLLSNKLFQISKSLFKNLKMLIKGTAQN